MFGFMLTLFCVDQSGFDEYLFSDFIPIAINLNSKKENNEEFFLKRNIRGTFLCL